MVKIATSVIFAKKDIQMKALNYILGLDLGIASVGWAVVEIDQNELPIRLFDIG